jgi:copper(I)-binding protein
VIVRKKFIASAMLSLMIGMAVPLNTACRSENADLKIESPQAVLSPLIIGSASVFMHIKNRGKGSDVLIGARVNFPGSITELHDLDEGRMQKTDEIPIPPATTVRLRPIGQHVMIYKMPRDIKPGTACTLTLVFKKSGEMTIPLTLSDTYENTLSREYRRSKVIVRG